MRTRLSKRVNPAAGERLFCKQKGALPPASRNFAPSCGTSELAAWGHAKILVRTTRQRRGSRFLEARRGVARSRPPVRQTSAVKGNVLRGVRKLLQKSGQAAVVKSPICLVLTLLLARTARTLSSPALRDKESATFRKLVVPFPRKRCARLY